MITSAKKPKTRLVRILHRRIDSIRPSPENSRLYRPIDPAAPDIVNLAQSIRKHGVQQPLGVTKDGYIYDGHRRYAAARLAGLKKVPCRVEPFNKEDDHDRFMTLLVECNRQRVKSLSEKLREEVLSADPDQAYQALIDHREEQSVVYAETFAIRAPKRRATITKAKEPFLDAITNILEENRKFWPLSVRNVHYYLLNGPPLKHASKPKSAYVNDRKSYQSLDELTVRARLEGIIPWAAIDDETRPIVTWDIHPDPQGYIRNELDGFLKGYWRDLMQSQPNHVEILGEKLTVQGIIKPVAMRYRIPYTLGKGFANLPVRYKMAQRFQQSGKERLVLLVLSDHDPDGDEIAHSFARSMRDDFGIRKIEPIRVALTADQVEEYGLAADNLTGAKKTSTNYRRFVARYGRDDAFELEAIKPEQLQVILADAIDSVIDADAFNHEVDCEKADAAFLDGVRRTVHSVLADIDFGDHAPGGDDA